MNPLSVLLVDGNPTFLRIVERLLHDHYHEAVTLVGAIRHDQSLLIAATAAHPHVILLGMGMTGLNDLAVIPQLRALLPDVHIIALGALDVGDYRRAALALGADEFFPKTTLNTNLLPAIRRAAYIRRRSAHSALQEMMGVQERACPEQADDEMQASSDV